MMFKEDTPLYAYEVKKEGGENVMYINYLGSPVVPNLADNEEVMNRTIDYLIESPNVSRIVFVQQRNYNYDFGEVKLLLEVAQLYNYLVNQENILSPQRLGREMRERYDQMTYFLTLLKQDPIAAYRELNRILRGEKSGEGKSSYVRLLEKVVSLMDDLILIKKAKPYFDQYEVGDREIYRQFFRPDIIPNFTFTRLVSQLPEEAQIVDEYEIGEGYDKSTVTILKEEGKSKYTYHLTPPEYTLDEDHHVLLNMARNVMIEHRPKAEEFTDMERTRQTFFNISRDLLQDLANNKNVNLSYNELNRLATILVRYTIGFGLIEVFLQDKKLQDVVLNAPIPKNPVFVRHQDYDECQTNVLPSQEDAESWAAKFRMLSGRPLDESNPVLDTQLTLGNVRSRVAAVQEPLSPRGLSYAIRRHREEPWTLPLFIDNKMINSFSAGLMSFLVDGARSMIIAGTRSSGKTSMLGALMQEIMPKYRTVVVEDTLELPVESLREIGYDILRMKVRSALLQKSTEVEASEGIRTSLRLGDSSLIVGEIRSSLRGDQEVMLVDNGITKRVPIKDVEKIKEKNSRIKVPSIDLNKNNKFKLEGLSDFVKHPKRKELVKVKTKTGREVTVTDDHSVFTANSKFEIEEIETNKLEEGDKIVVPASLPSGYNDRDEINLLSLLEDLRVSGHEKYFREAIDNIGYKKAGEICQVPESNDIYLYLRKGKRKSRPKVKVFQNLMKEADIDYDLGDLKIKEGTSKTLPAKFPLNRDFCRFLGYYVAEGYVSNEGSVIIHNSNQDIIEDIKKISKNLFGVEVYEREKEGGKGRSKELKITNTPLAHLILNLGCGRTSGEKRVPPIIYGLSDEKIGSFLKGAYSGDGSQTSCEGSGNAIKYSTTSKDLANDMMYLLLTQGIVARIYERTSDKENHRDLYNVVFKQREFVKKFLEVAGFTKYNKEIHEKAVPHSPENSVDIDPEYLDSIVDLPRKYRHLRREKKCGKNYLKKIGRDTGNEEIGKFANGEFYLDEVESIEKIELEEPEYVYDLSAEPSENFVGGFGGILLHNTEAQALYEAMRVGALSNVVAGTIHGANPYSVFDRVVNDLNVPATSFKATDIIMVTNPVKSPSGLESWRRMVQMTEVRKHWEEDPSRENGFVDLLKYNVEKDELEVSDDLINGDSQVVKDVASGVKGWAGDWDAVWDNIQLRAKVKQALVKKANKMKLPDLMEAKFNNKANIAFHEISNKIKKEIGLPTKKRVFPEWQKWLNKEAKKLKKGRI